ncbi:mitochondrial matrix Mmp37-domain-containing protein [Apiospora marii]|uniref:Mitochondrial matrix Mmp37-domain-containing protein n=1 Tax=Apiospora marii TaxID=335849 RepID=A0ABR1REB4_9PEZI
MVRRLPKEFRSKLYFKYQEKFIPDGIGVVYTVKFSPKEGGPDIVRRIDRMAFRAKSHLKVHL